MAHVYILKSRKSGQFYIGSTIELQRRIAEHTNGKVKSTKGFRPLELVFSQEYATAAEAKSIEYKLKQLKSRDAIKKIIKNGYIKTTGCGADG